MPSLFWVCAFFWQVFQNSTLRVHIIVFLVSIFFGKKHFPNCISHYRLKRLRLMSSFFKHGCRNCIIFMQGNLPLEKDFGKALFFFHLRKLDKTYLDICCENSEGVVRTTLYVSTCLFSWEAQSLKKKHFSNCILHFRLKKFGFSVKRFQHGTQNCIGSRFFIRIYANFLWNSRKFFSWSVRTALYVSTGLFSREAIFLEKTLFQLYFTF